MEDTPMKKALLIFAAVLTLACMAAMPFLCVHSDILPEISTAYYDYRAKEEALTATGPEAELMRMLTGLSADTKLEPVSTPLAFSRYGMGLAIGALLSLLLLFVLNRRETSLRNALVWTGVLAVPFGFFGARLVYSLVNIPFYLGAIAAPEAMLKSWEGGLSIAGALAFAALAGVVGARLGKASVGRVLDAMIVPLLALAFAAAGTCAYMNVGFGPEVSESFITTVIEETPRLNAPLLVMLAMLLLFVISLLTHKFPAGTAFALFAFLYGSVMILLESLREDGHMVWGFVHAEMAFDLCFALPALLYLARTKKHILLSLAMTALLAGAVVGLEFALDRSNLGDGLLYVVYAAVMGGYIILGCVFTRKRLTA